jgi:hypothetical protein
MAMIIPFAGVAVEDYSKPSFDRFFTEDMAFSVITFAETNFMKAEAALKGWGGSETAEAYYYAGIDASFDQYGVSGADMYKEQDGIKWGTESVGRKDLWSVVTSGISADPMDKIVTAAVDRHVLSRDMIPGACKKGRDYYHS